MDNTDTSNLIHYECEITLDVEGKKDTDVFTALAFAPDEDFIGFKLRDGSWQYYSRRKIVRYSIKAIQTVSKI